MRIKHEFTLSFLLLCLMLAGCSDPRRQMIVGTWVMDEVELVADQIGNETSAESPNMLVQFESSGKLLTETTMGSINSQKVGTWKLIEYDAAKKTLVIECDLQQQKTDHEIVFEGESTIRWIPPNMAGTTDEMTFRRR